MPRVTALLLAIVGGARALPSVLVTGAAGRTGSLLYHQLKADSRIGEVRALVRNVTKARSVLNCNKCDASEGIYVGDVTKVESMTAAMKGVDTLAIAAAVSGTEPDKVMRAVEFDGVENQVAALTSANNGTLGTLRVVLCSSMGTTYPSPKPMMGGPILFWKLNAEAFLFSSGVGTTVVKPCGLSDKEGGQHKLVVGHDDHLPTMSFMVPRADVAAVMAEAIVQRTSGLRFGMCTKAIGSKTTDYAALLKEAQWPWM